LLGLGDFLRCVDQLNDKNIKWPNLSDAFSLKRDVARLSEKGVDF